jgi:hypothetical protein
VLIAQRQGPQRGERHGLAGDQVIGGPDAAAIRSAISVSPPMT